MISAQEAQARILVVDDHLPNLIALEAILEPLGQPVVRASSGEEALRFLLKDDFAVILLDAQMPGLDGFETATLIKSRERSRSIPIIFLTALSRDADCVFEGYSTGAVDYLLKPFDPGILRSKVSVFIDLFLKTEQVKQQAERLREHDREALERKSEKRYRRLVDLMPLSVCAMHPDGTVYYRNRWLQAYLGVDSAEPKDVERFAGVHQDDVARLQRMWSTALSSGEAAIMQYRLRRASDGAYRWHESHAVPDRDEEGLLLGWITTTIDVEDKLSDEARATLARQAREDASPLRPISGEFRAITAVS